MSFSGIEIHVLEAVVACAESPDSFCSCAEVLQNVLERQGEWNDATELAVSNTGYEHPDVAILYDSIRGLVFQGFLEGRGDLMFPAGPKDTACRITAHGKEMLSDAK
jgi:hypothetical protein